MEQTCVPAFDPGLALLWSLMYCRFFFPISNNSLTFEVRHFGTVYMIMIFEVLFIFCSVYLPYNLNKYITTSLNCELQWQFQGPTNLQFSSLFFTSFERMPFNCFLSFILSRSNNSSLWAVKWEGLMTKVSFIWFLFYFVSCHKDCPCSTWQWWTSIFLCCSSSLPSDDFSKWNHIFQPVLQMGSVWALS